MKFLSGRFTELTIILVTGLLFIPFLGNVHLFDWDEINFAEAAREMIKSGNYLTVQIDFQPFWEKPPLFIWMQVLSMKIFGINEFAARFPNAVCGIVTSLAIFKIGKRLKDENSGIIWVCVYVCSILPFFYFKSGIIDPWFNLFIFLGIYYTFRFFLYNNEKNHNLDIALSALFIGLAILAKGPVALLIYLLTFTIYNIIKMFKLKIKLSHIILFVVILTLVGGFWFILQLINGNAKLINDFISYQVRLFQTKDAGHGGFFLYHFVVLFIGVFPASIFMLYSFRIEKKQDREPINEFKNWMMILFWTALLLFTIVKTKIIHYSSICYFPLTFLATYGIVKIIEHKENIPKWMSRLFITVSCIWGIIIIVIQLIAKYATNIIASGIIQDQFAAGNLEAHIDWSGKEWISGLLFVLIIILLLTFKKLNIRIKIFGIMFTTLAFTCYVIMVVTPKIEGYSQRAAIEFYIQHKNEDCYIQPIGFKTYADLYYADKNIPLKPESRNENWLLSGPADKPVYFVMKTGHSDKFLAEHPQLKVLYRKNGFVFVKRVMETGMY